MASEIRTDRPARESRSLKYLQHGSGFGRSSSLSTGFTSAPGVHETQTTDCGAIRVSDQADACNPCVFKAFSQFDALGPILLSQIHLKREVFGVWTGVNCHGFVASGTGNKNGCLRNLPRPDILELRQDAAPAAVGKKYTSSTPRGGTLCTTESTRLGPP